MCMNVNYISIHASMHMFTYCVPVYIYMVYIYGVIFAGGLTRQKLLKEFIEKCFQPLDSASNVATLLHAKVFAPMCQFHLTCRAVLLYLRLGWRRVFKIRQLSKEWRSSLKGFEWLTPVDMASLGWPEYLGFIYFAAAYRDAMSALLCHLADMSAV